MGAWEVWLNPWSGDVGLGVRGEEVWWPSKGKEIWIFRKCDQTRKIQKKQQWRRWNKGFTLLVRIAFYVLQQGSLFGDGGSQPQQYGGHGGGRGGERGRGGEGGSWEGWGKRGSGVGLEKLRNVCSTGGRHGGEDEEMWQLTETGRNPWLWVAVFFSALSNAVDNDGGVMDSDWWRNSWKRYFGHIKITTLHYNNTALLQHCIITTLQHYNTTTLQHYNIALLQHCIITTLQHYNNTILQYYSITTFSSTTIH